MRSMMERGKWSVNNILAFEWLCWVDSLEMFNVGIG